ncbi:thioredoxin family protein [Neptuniibacter halophilus]|uniref:thioredoxin family protein n=1 Tax=Neptuniibacter halophilus TaxID=651666 RepID=UPI002572D2B9|nr:thioredoxin family protein [Neptuniibacter halophilus]
MAEQALTFSVNGHSYPQPLALLWFSANWCGPCQQMNPVMQQLAGQSTEQVRVLKIDVDQQSALSADFSIRAVPTLVLLGANGEIDRQVGSAGLGQLSQWLDRSLARLKHTGEKYEY